MAKSSLKQNEGVTPFTLEQVPLDQLKPHPRNYQVHPDDEIAHLMKSIEENGIYRNVVLARDRMTILAGHGVVEAARRLNLTCIPAYYTKWNANDPRALKLLAGDNEISHLAEVDDRALTELLRELKDADIDLLGTGYDDMMLANLVMVTRPASEIADLDAAAQWIGMPEYDLEGEHQIKITVHFVNDEDRKEFCHILNLKEDTKDGVGKSIWWPQKVKDDVKAIGFVGSQEGEND